MGLMHRFIMLLYLSAFYRKLFLLFCSYNQEHFRTNIAIQYNTNYRLEATQDLNQHFSGKDSSTNIAHRDLNKFKSHCIEFTGSCGIESTP